MHDVRVWRKRPVALVFRASIQNADREAASGSSYHARQRRCSWLQAQQRRRSTAALRQAGGRQPHGSLTRTGDAGERVRRTVLERCATQVGTSVVSGRHECSHHRQLTQLSVAVEEGR